MEVTLNIPMNHHLVVFLQEKLDGDPYRLSRKDHFGQFILAFTHHKVHRRSLNHKKQVDLQQDSVFQVSISQTYWESGFLDLSPVHMKLIRDFVDKQFRDQLICEIEATRIYCQNLGMDHNILRVIDEFLFRYDAFDHCDSQSMYRNYLRFKKKRGIGVRSFNTRVIN